VKILIVSWSILPQTGGSSVIVENLAQNFTQDELVVFGSSTWSRKAVSGRKANGARFQYFFSELNFMGRGNRFFSWFRKGRFGGLMAAIEKIIKDEKIDHVIGVYPNDLYCLAACRAAKKLGVPFSSYFHNTYTDNVAITDSNAAAYQAEIFSNSARVFVMSDGMLRFYKKQYNLDNLVPLVHTFNAYPSSTELTGIPGTEKDTYELVAIGNFNESNIDATKRLLNAIAGNPKYHLNVYTNVPRLLLQKRGINTDLFTHRGAVAPEQIHAELQKYDICVLTHGFEGGYGEIEYQTIFPTRTIPLLLSGKPIFAHSPQGSFLNSFIEEKQCACLVDVADTKDIVNGLDKVANDREYQQLLVQNAGKAAAQFYGPTVIKELLQELKSSEA